MALSALRSVFSGSPQPPAPASPTRTSHISSPSYSSRPRKRSITSQSGLPSSQQQGAPLTEEQRLLSSESTQEKIEAYFTNGGSLDKVRLQFLKKPTPEGLARFQQCISAKQEYYLATCGGRIKSLFSRSLSLADEVAKNPELNELQKQHTSCTGQENQIEKEAYAEAFKKTVLALSPKNTNATAKYYKAAAASAKANAQFEKLKKQVLEKSRRYQVAQLRFKAAEAEANALLEVVKKKHSGKKENIATRKLEVKLYTLAADLMEFGLKMDLKINVASHQKAPNHRELLTQEYSRVSKLDSRSPMVRFWAWLES